MGSTRKALSKEELNDCSRCSFTLGALYGFPYMRYRGRSSSYNDKNGIDAMYNNLFSNIPVKKGSRKPRESRLTVIIDRGLG